MKKYKNRGESDRMKLNISVLAHLPDQILGFDSWSLDTTTNDARAGDVDPPGNRNNNEHNV